MQYGSITTSEEDENGKKYIGKSTYHKGRLKSHSIEMEESVAVQDKNDVISEFILAYQVIANKETKRLIFEVETDPTGNYPRRIIKRHIVYKNVSDVI